MTESEKKKEAFDKCDCGGTAAEPWNYCDDCCEYLEELENTMYQE